MCGSEFKKRPASAKERVRLNSHAIVLEPKSLINGRIPQLNT
jgi:hypothetical protein